MAEPCPPAARWKEHLDGTLPADQQAVLSEHLDSCAGCRKTLETLAGGSDSLLEVARQAVGASDAATPALHQVLAQFQSSPSEATQADVSGALDDSLSFLAPCEKSGYLGRLGHYAVQQVIGKGGFGIVLKAFDERLQRVVAIKVLSPAYAANGSARKRFIREAQTAAAIKNEHVIGIYDVEKDEQPPYLAMEMIDGISLQDKIDKQGPLHVTEILRIGLQTAEGLAAAHKQGLVHRDIKPANILLENGVERVKITDFGLARAVDDASVTQSGTVAGTPMYMSPEQAEGAPVDHRSDLFSLGTVLYAMCTGHPPFRASGTHAVLKRVIDASPRPIRETNSEIPEWLEGIIAKLHAKKPEDRYQTSKEVAELLGQRLADVQTGRAIQCEPSRVSDRVEDRGPATRPLTRLGSPGFGSPGFGSPGFGSPGSRRRWVVAAVVVLGVLAGGLAVSEFAGLTHLTHAPSYSVSLEMDDKDILVRIWPTVQTEPPANLAGPFEILGKPTHEIHNVAAKEIALAAGNYWLAAELDGQEVHRVFMKIRSDSFHVNYQDQFGPVFGWVGKETRGLARIVAIPGALNLVQKEKGKLHGAWRAVSGERDGKAIYRKMIDAVNFRLRFEGDRVAVQMNETRETKATNNEGDYTLDPRKKPAVLEITDAIDGKAMHCVYRWEGDKLRLCGSSKERPSDFTTKPGSERMLFVLERVSGNDSKTESGWVQLFNGTDLRGWSKKQPKAKGAWQVVDGMLKGQATEPAFLWNDREDFRDFHLKVETRVQATGDGGILFRFAPGTEGYEAEIRPGSQVPTGSLWRYTDFAKLATTTTFPPPDEWFTLEVIARGSRLQVLVNGKTTADVFDTTSMQGRLALQADGTGGSIEYRKIEIKELPPAPPPRQFALRFSGEHQFVDVPTLKLDPKGPFTIEAEVTLDDRERLGPGFIAGVRSQSGIAIENDRWRFFGYAKPDKTLRSVVPPFTQGQRVHLALVTNGGKLRPYVNGKHPSADQALEELVPTDDWFRIGGFPGLVHQVRVSSVARTEFTPGKRFEVDKDTLALYACDEGQDAKLTDSSGKGHHGNIIRAKWVNPDGSPLAQPEPWVQLFNGYDLKGWGGDEKIWKVEDGELINKFDGSSGSNYLSTERGKHANFHLRATVRVVPVAGKTGTSGVWVRSIKDEAGYKAHLSTGAGQAGTLMVRDNYKYVPTKLSKDGISLPGDQWFDLEIIAQGPNLVVKINGIETANVKDERYREGYIRLERVPDSMIYFKKIEIKELPPTASPALIDTKTEKPTQSFPHAYSGQGTVSHLEFRNRDKLLVAALDSRLVRFWNVDTKEQLFEAVAPRSAARKACLSADGRTLFAAGEESGTSKRANSRAPGKLRLIPPGRLLMGNPWPALRLPGEARVNLAAASMPLGLRRSGAREARRRPRS